MNNKSYALELIRLFFNTSIVSASGCVQLLKVVPVSKVVFGES